MYLWVFSIWLDPSKNFKINKRPGRLSRALIGMNRVSNGILFLNNFFKVLFSSTCVSKILAQRLFLNLIHNKNPEVKG